MLLNPPVAQVFIGGGVGEVLFAINLLAPELFFFNFSTPCI